MYAANECAMSAFGTGCQTNSGVSSSSQYTSTISSVYSALKTSLVPSDFSPWEPDSQTIDHRAGNRHDQSGSDVTLHDVSYVSILNDSWTNSSTSESESDPEPEVVKAKSEGCIVRENPIRCQRAKTTNARCFEARTQKTPPVDPKVKSEVTINSHGLEDERICKSMQNLLIKPQQYSDEEEVSLEQSIPNLQALARETPLPPCPKDSNNKYAHELLKIPPDKKCRCTKLTEKGVTPWSKHEPQRKTAKAKHVNVARVPDMTRFYTERYRLRAAEHYRFHHYEDTDKYIEQYRLYHTIGSVTGTPARQPRFGIDMPDPYQTRIRKYMYSDVYDRLRELNQMADDAAQSRARFLRDHCPATMRWEEAPAPASDQAFRPERRPKEEFIPLSRQYTLEYTTPKERWNHKMDCKQRSVFADAFNRRNTVHDLKALKLGGRAVVESLLVENRPLKALKRKYLQAHKQAMNGVTETTETADDVVSVPSGGTVTVNEFIPTIPPRTSEASPKLSHTNDKLRDAAARNDSKSPPKLSKSEDLNLPKLPVPVPPKRVSRSEEAVILQLGKSQFARKHYRDYHAFLNLQSPPEPSVYVIPGMTGGKIIRRSKKEIKARNANYHQDFSDGDAVAIIKHFASKNPNITEMIFHEINDVNTYQKCLSQLRKFGAQEKKAKNGSVPVATVSLCEVYSTSAASTSGEQQTVFRHRQRGPLGRIGVKGSKCEADTT